MRALSAILYLILLTGCLNDSYEDRSVTGTEGEAGSNGTAKAEPPPKVYKASEVLPKGTWINHVYLQTLTETRSPYESQKVFWNGTAGKTGYVKFDGDTFNSWHHVHAGAYRQVATMIDPYNFEIRNNKTEALLFKGAFTHDYKELTLQPITVVGKTTTLFYYPEPDFKEAFNTMMIAGTYKSYNAAGKETGDITFGKDGKLTGVDGHEEYILFYDYNGRGMNLDQIAFGTDRRTAGLYGWVQNDDTIRLYNLKCTRRLDETRPEEPFNCIFYGHNKLYRKLVRQR